MAEHQGLPVAGYKPQSDEKVQIVNHNKEIEEICLRILDTLKTENWVDQRWLAIGRTHIEEGFMAVNRAVFQPGRVKIAADEINMPTVPTDPGDASQDMSGRKPHRG